MNFLTVHLNQYLVHFKGDLKGLENTHHKFKLNKSDINKRFAQILKEIGLIKDFKNEINKSPNWVTKDIIIVINKMFSKF